MSESNESSELKEMQNRPSHARRGYIAHLHEFQARVDAAVEELNEHKIMNRIWAHDHTVWKPDPTEISNRFGWLHSPEVMLERIPEIEALVNQVRSDGYTQAVLLGMGGSSLAPEVFRYTFGVKQGFLDLSVLDSTDPGTILDFAEKYDPANTLYVVSTKSGGTVETLSFFKHFYNRALSAVGADNVGRHFVAITDPGSKLADLAQQYDFRKTFLNDVNIGGRYSVLSFFGLVPAGLIGMDLRLLLDRAATMASSSKGSSDSDAGENTGAWLGATMGEFAVIGRDKVTLITSPKLSYFGAWAEQLVAESTGKEGKGILPVDGERIGSPDVYANDRLFVSLRLAGDGVFDAEIDNLIASGQPVVKLALNDTYDLGAEFFRWEIATIVASRALRINPFDQPNVESAKVVARGMVDEYHEKGELPNLSPALRDDDIEVYTDIVASNAQDALRTFLDLANAGVDGKDRSYVALQAFAQATPETTEALQELRHRIRDRFRVATTAGYGPRFLHSTGQLHKGDGGHGLFIQFTANMPEDAAIPDKAGEPASGMTFGVLKTAQALGDRQALLNADRKVIRFHFNSDVADGLRKIAEILK